MSDPILHECGIAFIRLLKPLAFYQEKYGTPLYGLNKLQFLMAKQLNRGQDGAGLGVIKLNPEFGHRYIARKRSISSNAIADIFGEIKTAFEELDPEMRRDPAYLKTEFPYAGELLLGHLRYGTHGGNSIENIHPFLRQNNWMSRNLVLAGNYNLTNVDEMFKLLVELGQQPKEKSDNVTLLEKIGHFLDVENQELFDDFKAKGHNNFEISELIKKHLNLENVLKRTFKSVDGGFNLIGMVGHGDAFILRDPAGIRPSFYYLDDEVLVCASERPPIMTAFNLELKDVKELGPGNAIIVKNDGTVKEINICPPTEKRSCSFERIYFSRGNDADIYQERKKLGQLLSRIVLKRINYDLANTVFSYVPNTAATSFYGMIDGLNEYLHDYQQYELRRLLEKQSDDNVSEDWHSRLEEIMTWKVRREKILNKDGKMRTFITNDTDREGLVGHVYDITYGVVKPGQDNLVIMDDSIVRGTTLKTSILRILDRLGPKKIVMVSSAPQIRYPDCYGIDMSKLNDFVAFKAAIELLKEKHQEHVITETYQKCKEELLKPISEMRNVVKDIYKFLEDDEITRKVAQIVSPENCNAEIEIVYQTIENLHEACPGHSGDWYFTGNYPTPGGNKVANKSFVFYMEGVQERAY